MLPRQLGLSFDGDDVSVDAGFTGMRRLALAEGAWIEHLPGWVRGHERLYETIVRGARWHTDKRMMYDREVDTPRLLAVVPKPAALDPIIERMRVLLSQRYATDFNRVSLALYRDGNDSVAMHGDTTARDLPEAIVATVSLGSPRRLLCKPTAGGPSIAFELGMGDLFVMGGTCQRTWRHGIPKVAAPVGPRIALMFRPDLDRVTAVRVASKWGRRSHQLPSEVECFSPFTSVYAWSCFCTHVRPSGEKYTMIDSMRLRTMNSVSDLDVLKDEFQSQKRMLKRAEVQGTIFRAAFFMTMGMLLWALHQQGFLPFIPR